MGPFKNFGKKKKFSSVTLVFSYLNKSKNNITFPFFFKLKRNCGNIISGKEMLKCLPEKKKQNWILNNSNWCKEWSKNKNKKIIFCGLGKRVLYRYVLLFFTSHFSSRPE